LIETLLDFFKNYLAGKKVQISNHFAKDLGEILDFIDRFRPEIDAIGKEPEKLFAMPEWVDANNLLKSHYKNKRNLF
jgi:hypothetical protein